MRPALRLKTQTINPADCRTENSPPTFSDIDNSESVIFATNELVGSGRTRSIDTVQFSPRISLWAQSSCIVDVVETGLILEWPRCVEVFHEESKKMARRATVR